MQIKREKKKRTPTHFGNHEMNHLLETIYENYYDCMIKPHVTGHLRFQKEIFRDKFDLKITLLCGKLLCVS